MRAFAKSASIFALASALAACGGSADTDETALDSDERAAADMAAPETAPGEGELAETAEGEQADEADGADADEMAEPEPDASEGANVTPVSTPSPTPTQAAVARPPIFAVCGACHSVDPGNHGLGPSLAGVGGAAAGHADGFDYSDALESSGLTWDRATLDRYLKNPQQVIPGTTMAYPGMKNDEQRKAVIDYLMSL